MASASVPALRKYVDVGLAPGALHVPEARLHPNLVSVYEPPPGGFCVPVLEQPEPTIPADDWHSKSDEPIRMPGEIPLFGVEESGSKVMVDICDVTIRHMSGTLPAATSLSHVAPLQVEDQ